MLIIKKAPVKKPFKRIVGQKKPAKVETEDEEEPPKLVKRLPMHKIKPVENKKRIAIVEGIEEQEENETPNKAVFKRRMVLKPRQDENDEEEEEKEVKMHTIPPLKLRTDNGEDDEAEPPKKFFRHKIQIPKKREVEEDDEE